MRKIVTLCICGMMAAALAAGCSKTQTAPAGSTEGAVSGNTSVSDGSLAVETEADPEIGDVSSLTLGEYKGLQLEALPTEVTEEELESEVEGARRLQSKWEEVDRPAQLEDRVNIDFLGKKDGVPFDGGKAEGYDLELGSGNFIPGFEEGLVGAAKGEKRSLDLTFPENYGNADLAGKAVVFDVTVNKIEENRTPEMDDELVKSISDYATVEEYRDATRENLEQQKSMNAKNQLRMEALQALVDSSQIVCASADVEKLVEEQLEYTSSTMESQGMSIENYLGMMGTNLDEFKGIIRDGAKEEVKAQMVVDAVIEKEGLTVGPEYVDALMEEFSVDKDSYIQEYGQETFDDMVRKFFVADYLVEQAEITEAK